MPLSERDYMRRPRPTRQPRFNLDPIWVIISLNLLVFIIANIFSRAVYFLGLSPLAFPLQPWTIITSFFTHVEIWHILFNMLAFFFFGRFLSALIGNRRFLLVYLGGGILGNIVYLLLASPFSIAVGASGAIFALGGALAVLRPQERVFIFPIPAPIPLWVAVVGGFLILFFLPSVAWQAHLGGLVFGLGTGYFLKRRHRHY